MNYTKSVGNITELKCLIAFIDLGFDCSIPYGDSAKYDILVDVGDKILRVQCKTATALEDDTGFYIRCVSQTTNTKKTVRHTYKGFIDYFATVWKDQVYLIPIDECSQAKTLRTIAPRNGNTNYSKAEDYIVAKVLESNISASFLEDKESRKNSIKETTIKETTIKKKACPICGKPMGLKGTTCSECSHILARKVDRPNRETLKSLIRTTPFTKIGEKYEVSDNTIRKWCISYGLPFRVSEIKRIDDKDWNLL